MIAQGGAFSPQDWDRLFKILWDWRAVIEREDGGAEDLSVNSVAERTGGDPWAVLSSTIISLRTKDEVTGPASRRLLARAPTPRALLGLSEQELEGLIFPAGFFRNKAKNLRAIALLLEEKGGKVPSSLEELLSLPGVGLKTANLVLSQAFGKPAICVDIHVHRIANRMGIVTTKNPDESEAALRAVLPLRYWRDTNSLLVLYGRRVCTPRGPKCSICVIKLFCAQRDLISFR